MQDLIISPQLTILAADLDVSFMRSSGPGGQNVNKVNSKVRLAWNISADTTMPTAWKNRVTSNYPTRLTINGRLVVVSQQYRDQARNVQDVRGKLRQILLACQYPPPNRKATQPTYSSRLKRLEGKRQLGSTKRLRRPPDASA